MSKRYWVIFWSLMAAVIALSFTLIITISREVLQNRTYTFERLRALKLNNLFEFDESSVTYVDDNGDEELPPADKFTSIDRYFNYHASTIGDLLESFTQVPTGYEWPTNGLRYNPSTNPVTYIGDKASALQLIIGGIINQSNDVTIYNLTASKENDLNGNGRVDGDERIFERFDFTNTKFIGSKREKYNMNQITKPWMWGMTSNGINKTVSFIFNKEYWTLPVTIEQ